MVLDNHKVNVHLQIEVSVQSPSCTQEEDGTNVRLSQRSMVRPLSKGRDRLLQPTLSSLSHLPWDQSHSIEKAVKDYGREFLTELGDQEAGQHNLWPVLMFF